MFPPLMDEFQEIRGVIVRELEQKPFIEDQQCGIGVFLQYLWKSSDGFRDSG